MIVVLQECRGCAMHPRSSVYEDHFIGVMPFEISHSAGCGGDTWWVHGTMLSDAEADASGAEETSLP